MKAADPQTLGDTKAMEDSWRDNLFNPKFSGDKWNRIPQEPIWTMIANGQGRTRHQLQGLKEWLGVFNALKENETESHAKENYKADSLAMQMSSHEMINEDRGEPTRWLE